jgi:hypothetical protein
MSADGSRKGASPSRSWQRTKPRPQKLHPLRRSPGPIPCPHTSIANRVGGVSTPIQTCLQGPAHDAANALRPPPSAHRSLFRPTAASESPAPREAPSSSVCRYHRRMPPRRAMSCVLFTLIAVACSDGAPATQPPEASVRDASLEAPPSPDGATGVDVTSPPHDVFDVAPESSLPDLAAEAATDVPVDREALRCTSAMDCMGRACDRASGRCVECTTDDDRCPPAFHCNPTGFVCVNGCRSDEGCPANPDAGVAARRCDTALHRCVACLTHTDCPPGRLCVDHECVPGCDPTHPCPSGRSCCSGMCVDLSSDLAACGACGQPCRAPNGVPVCRMGVCTVASCNDGFADCTAADGCETSLRDNDLHCGACHTRCEHGARCRDTTCVCPGGSIEAACDDGADNDCDGRVDCADGDCAALATCCERSGRATSFDASGMFVVPAGVTTVLVKAWGGGGGGGGRAGGHGGAGGFSSALITVTPEERLTVTVGTGGHAGDETARSAGGGGGASSVRRGTVRLLVAGGGGGGGATGGGASHGGAGGGIAGASGDDSSFGCHGGSGGTQSTAGLGGRDDRGHGPGQHGTTTAGGAGGGNPPDIAGGAGDGAGGVGRSFAGDGGGGGGGGGWFGGGGGGAGAWGCGGGGGSGYVPIGGSTLTGIGATPPRTSDPYWTMGTAAGGAPGSPGRAGRVVIFACGAPP